MHSWDSARGMDRYAASAHRPTALLTWGVGLLVLVLGVGLITRLDPANPPWQGLDQAWRDLVGGSPGDQNGIVASIFDALGHTPWALVVMLAPLVVLLVMRHWRSALFWLALVVLSSLLIQGTKKTVVRPRPPDPIVDPAALDLGSYPSGHAGSMGMLMVGLAAVLVPLWRRYWWILGAVLCLLMVWQRTMVGAHWLSDALAGVAVGASAGLILWWAFYPAIRRDFARRKA